MTCTAVSLTPACYPACLLSSALGGGTNPWQNLSLLVFSGQREELDNQETKRLYSLITEQRSRNPERARFVAVNSVQIFQNWKALTLYQPFKQLPFTRDLAVSRRHTGLCNIGWWF